LILRSGLSKAGYPSVTDCTLNTQYRIVSYRCITVISSDGQKLTKKLVTNSLTNVF